MIITPSSTATKTSPSGFRLVNQDSGHQRRHTIESVRQKTKRPFASFRHDAGDSRFFGEDLKWQQNFKIHERRRRVRASRNRFRVDSDVILGDDSAVGLGATLDLASDADFVFVPDWESGFAFCLAIGPVDH